MTRKLLATVLLAMLALAPASARADLPPEMIGIAPQHPSNRADFRLMREANVASVRVTLFWRGVQPRSPRVQRPDWSGFDRDVEMAAEQGIRVLAVLIDSPDWVASDPKALPVRTAFQRWAWANFVRGAVQRYGSGGTFWREHEDLPYLPITQWEVWNEMNIVTFMKGPDPGRYARLLRISGRILHREDPEAKVIVGGLFGRPLQTPPNVSLAGFLDGIYKAGRVKPFFDGVALHPYVADARAMGHQLNTMRRIMRRRGDGRTPIYVTEMGWGSRGGPTRWERGLYGQANQLSRAFSMLSARRAQWRIRGVWWYAWTDEGGACLFCGSAGLLTSERKAKPSWYRFNAWTGGDPESVSRLRVGD